MHIDKTQTEDTCETVKAFLKCFEDSHLNSQETVIVTAEELTQVLVEPSPGGPFESTLTHIDNLKKVHKVFANMSKK